jgi:hypothetical protein
MPPKKKHANRIIYVSYLGKKLNIITIHGFLTRIYSIKKTQNAKCKKDHLVNIDNSIWTCQRDLVLNLDHVILIDKVMDYLSKRPWTI